MVNSTFPVVACTLPPAVQAAPVTVVPVVPPPPPPPPVPGGLPACGFGRLFGATSRGTACAMRCGVQYATTAFRSGLAPGAAAELPTVTKTDVAASTPTPASRPTVRFRPRSTGSAYEPIRRPQPLLGGGAVSGWRRCRAT